MHERTPGPWSGHQREVRGAAGGAPGAGHTPGFGGAGAYAGGGGQRGFTPRTTVNVPRNPIKNGKQELCDICGAFTHYRRDCHLNPNAVMMMMEQGEHQDAYLYHDEHVYVSDQPQYIYEEVKQQTGEEDSKAIDHVATLLASLSDKKKGPEEEVNVLFTYNNDLMDKGFGQVVLDTGCVKSVGSTVRVNAFMNTLHPATRAKIRVESSNRVFKFGGGQKRKSVGTFYIPCSLNNKNLILVMDAVEQDDLPCLLSKESMKKAGVNIDVVNDTAVFFGETIKLKENAAGHYVINLGDYNYGEEECAVMWSGEGKDDDEMMEDLVKMHRGLGHPSQKTFERMLKYDGSFNKHVHGLVNKLYQSCMTCLKHKKAKSTPKVAPSLSITVNDTVTLDLKLFPKRGRNVLYMIDDFSRYVKAVSIKGKEGETIVKEFMDKWIFGTPYGPPRQVHTDNGSEFVNKDFREMTERFGIRHITTGAHSPFSNGLNERNHHTVDLMMEKIMDSDPSISFEQALSKAVYAKNIMLNVHGFSPAQILTGRQPRLPGATNDNRPPQDEVDVTSKHVHDELKLMDTARDSWLQVDTGRRLKDAMQVRPSPLEHYEPGDSVYYRFGRDPRWHGPGRVVGQENKVIMIRHGGHIISTSQTRVFKPPTQTGQMASKGADTQPRAETAGRAGTPTVPDSAETDSDSDSDWGDSPATAAQDRPPAAQTPPEGLRGGEQRGEE